MVAGHHGVAGQIATRHVVEALSTGLGTVQFGTSMRSEVIVLGASGKEKDAANIHVQVGDHLFSHV